MNDVGLRMIRVAGPPGRVRVGVPLLDEYLEFAAGRARPNTVLAMVSKSVRDIAISLACQPRYTATVSSRKVSNQSSKR